MNKSREKLKSLSCYKYYRIRKMYDVIPVDVFTDYKNKCLFGAYIYGDYIYGWYNTTDRQMMKTVVRYGRVHKDSAFYCVVENRSRISL